jgi:hypothetical protein
MQYYISKSNFVRITTKYDIQVNKLNDAIYKKAIYFLSKVEINRILSIKQFLENSKNELFKFTGNGFIQDSYNYIHEESHHAKYHKDCQCKGLKSIYKDLEIPVEIKYKLGSEEMDYSRINEFRSWFKQKEISELYYHDQNKFIDKLQIKFQLSNPPRPVELGNGEIKRVANYSEQEIESKIDDLIKNASSFYNQSEKYRDILVKHNFSKKTYFITSSKYRKEKIFIDGTGYTNEEIRKIIAEFYTKIKKPIIDYLIDYWIIKLNPTLNFNENILEQLQFESCKLCCHSKSDSFFEIDIFDKDDEWEIASQYANNQTKFNTIVINDDLPF